MTTPRADSRPPSLTLGNLRVANRLRNEEFVYKLRQKEPGFQGFGLLFRTTELGGECGELLNKVKKLQRARWGYEPEVPEMMKEIEEELGDVLICLDLLAMELNISLSDSTIVKFNASSKKMHLSTKLTLGVADAYFTQNWTPERRLAWKAIQRGDTAL